jgi:hypothetical protein
MTKLRDYNMNGTIILGVDAGYGNYKTARCCFATSVSRSSPPPVFTRDYLEYEGGYYTIGEGHKDFVAEKSKDDDNYIRFNMEKGDECRAWELLHSPRVRQMFKSQNKFVIEAVNDYYDRCVEMKNDPYLETREKEDAFAERIVETVEKKVMSNLPALFGMYMAQMQIFSLSVPKGGVSGDAGRHDVWAGASRNLV